MFCAFCKPCVCFEAGGEEDALISLEEVVNDHFELLKAKTILVGGGGCSIGASNFVDFLEGLEELDEVSCLDQFDSVGDEGSVVFIVASTVRRDFFHYFSPCDARSSERVLGKCSADSAVSRAGPTGDTEKVKNRTWEMR